MLPRTLPGKRKPNPGEYLLRQVHGNCFDAQIESANECLVFLLDDSPPDSCAVFGGMKLTIARSADILISKRRFSKAIASLECTDRSKVDMFAALEKNVRETLVVGKNSLRTARQIIDYVDDWREMFTRVRALSLQERIGLWGELEVLRRLTPPDRALEVWHGPNAATFDFGGNDTCLEVKTSISLPVHHFALEQLIPPGKSKIFIASVLVRMDSGCGTSLGDMILRVRSTFSSPALFDRKLLRLGVNILHPGTERFSTRSLKVYCGERIPRPRDIPLEVSDIRFAVNILSCPCLSAVKSARALSAMVKG